MFCKFKMKDTNEGKGADMIRKAQEKDESAILQLLCELEETQFSKERFHELYLYDLKDERHACFVYEENDQISGMIHLQRLHPWHHHNEVMEIMELIVDQDARSSGIGHQLFTYAQQYAKEKGCEQIELATNQRRKRAHAFYERQGMLQSHYSYTKKL
jgi:PhnO protein